MQPYVLVVDDDPGIREIVEWALTDEGYTVVTVANGEEALRRVEQRVPAVVLLDLQMPVMTGWDVLHRLRASRVTAPVVFMTAGYQAQEEARRHGVAGFLAKPFDLADLLNAVDRFVAVPC